MIHYLKIKTRFKTKEQFDVRIIKICQNSMKLIHFLNVLNWVALCQLKRSQKHYRIAEKLVATFQFDYSKFINASTIFIREKYQTIDDESITVENEQYKQKIHSNWINNYFIDVHKFIIRWKREDKDFINLNFINKKKVRCASHWREKNKWQKNCVWIQKTNLNNNYKTMNFVKDSDRRVKRLKFMIIIFNHEWKKINERLRGYIKAFIKRLTWIIDEESNIIYSMFEARVSSKNKSKNSRN